MNPYAWHHSVLKFNTSPNEKKDFTLGEIYQSAQVAEDWGFNAFFNNRALKNPYHNYDEEHQAWDKGWTRAQELFIRLSEAYGFIPE